MEKNIEKKMPEYASILTRFGAIVIDGLLLLPFYFPFYLIPNPLLERDNQLSDPLLFFCFLLISGAIVFGFWNSIIRMGKTGQSLGRKFLSIAVLTREGKIIGVGRAAFREIIGRWISGIFCYIGYLAGLWDRDKQMWHDKMVRSYVYYVDEDFKANPDGFGIPIDSFSGKASKSSVPQPNTEGKKSAWDEVDTNTENLEKLYKQKILGQEEDKKDD